MRYVITSILILFLFSAECQKTPKEFSKSFAVSVTNPLGRQRQNELVVITPSQLSKITDFNPGAFIVTLNDNEIPSQYNRRDQFHKGIAFVIENLGAGQEQQYVIRYNPAGNIKREYPKLTQAELSYKTGGEWKNREYMGGNFKNTDYLRVPPEHKDHSWFIRYEGPGWESDKVGYRFYLDQRNATDVFGKLTTEPVLQKVGQDGFDSYHEIQPWGMDVMKVGKSLGIGSIGHLQNGLAIRVEKTDSVDCRISENGVLFSSILTNYYGWKTEEGKTNLSSTLSIHQGTRLSHQQLTLSRPLDQICTGVVKDKNGVLIKSQGDKNSFGYLATYGKQSLNNDELGLVVFFDSKSFLQFTEDQFSHIVTLKPVDGKSDYYFAGVWVKEPGGISNQSEFEKYLKEVSELLASPVIIRISSARKAK